MRSWGYLCQVFQFPPLGSSLISAVSVRRGAAAAAGKMAAYQESGGQVTAQGIIGTDDSSDDQPDVQLVIEGQRSICPREGCFAQRQSERYRYPKRAASGHADRVVPFCACA